MPMHEELEALRNIKDKEEQFGALQRFYEQYRTNISQRVHSNLQVKKYPMSHAAQAIGVDKAAFSRSLAGKFRAPVKSLVVLSHHCLEESTHETIFLGEKKPVLLPQHLALLAKEISKSTAAEARSELLTKVVEIFLEEYRAKQLPSIGVPEIVKLRIAEIAEEQYTTAMDIFGPDTPTDAKRVFRRYAILEGYDNAGSLFGIFYLTVMRDTSMDYFLVPDYTQFNDIAYKGDNGETVIVRNNDIVTIVSRILQLSTKGQTEVLQYAWECIMRLSLSAVQ